MKTKMLFLHCSNYICFETVNIFILGKTAALVYFQTLKYHYFQQNVAKNFDAINENDINLDH